MSQFFHIHPDNPQHRLIKQAVDIVEQGGVIIYPTDSCYALGCHLGDKTAAERIRRIRQLDAKHNFTIICRDLSEISIYAKVTNADYRLLKAATPGPYTFILKATREVPKRLQHPKKKTIGIRVPEHGITHLILETLGEPMMSTTLILPDDDMPLTDPYEMNAILGQQVDLIIDGGYCGYEPTAVIELENGVPEVIRGSKEAIDKFNF